jgi:beta-lactamase superfamily II metal-dependent hydrolase
MIVFEIKAIQAAQGDALFITYGENDAPKHMLIDGGVTDTLDNLLTVLRGARTNCHLRLEVIVITHYDDDHIQGIVALLSAKPEWLSIGDIWFNGRKHLHSRDLLGSQDADDLTKLLEDEDNKYPWNEAFGNSPITSSLPDPKPLAGGMKVQILSPDEKRLRDLAAKWKASTPPVDESGGTEADSLGRSDVWPLVKFAKYIHPPFRADTSVPNGSSIALMLEFDGKRALLAADSFAEVVKNSLLSRGPLPVLVNLLKVSHHGSKANTDIPLLKAIKCNRYLLSTNGAIYSHPDQALIARIITEHPGSEFIFNYQKPQTAGWLNAPNDWPALKTAYPANNDPYVVVRLS